MASVEGFLDNSYHMIKLGPMSLGTNIYLVGIKGPSKKWEKMKAVWDACLAADIKPPESVLSYFGHESPKEQLVHLDQWDRAVAGYCHKPEMHGADCKEGGWEIDLRKLRNIDPEIHTIRIYKSS